MPSGQLTTVTTWAGTFRHPFKGLKVPAQVVMVVSCPLGGTPGSLKTQGTL